jgi:signal transduction histidine kinase
MLLGRLDTRLLGVMDIETDVQVSDLKKELIQKTAELDRAIASIAELTKKLKTSVSSLKTAQQTIEASDAASAVRDTELRTAEDALKVSDMALEMKSEELVAAIENLADANDQLRHSRDLQNAFINVAAHELKNPIQPILGVADYLESLEHSGVGTDEIRVSREDLEMIVRNAKRLETLSNDILDVSRIEAKSLRLNKESFDLNGEIRDVVRDFQMYGAKNERVHISFRPSFSPDGTIIVYADKSRIYEVISNILSNAIKFTSNGSIVIISAVSKDGFAIVRIKDTGQGLSPELLSSIFTKFGVVGDSGDVKSGSGLGMFISKGIIDAHGGKIWAENNKDGNGATFTFTIPISG